MVEKILVAIGHTPVNPPLFHLSLQLAQMHQAELMFVSVLCLSSMEDATVDWLPPPYASSQKAMYLYVDALRHIEQQARSRLQLWAQQAIAAGVPAQYRQTIGEPGREICKLADQWGAHMMVVGRYNLASTLDRQVERVSRYVAQHATCNVLIVPLDRELSRFLLRRLNCEVTV